jgi:hypothetical protein
MISLGYPINESITGSLAQAFKGNLNVYAKFDLIAYCKEHNIDFNRSIGKATEVSDKNDPKLKNSPIIIGVTVDDNGDTKFSAWSNQTKSMITFSKIKIHGIKINFGSLSWNKWIEFCSDFFIIKDTDIVPLTKED